MGGADQGILRRRCRVTATRFHGRSVPNESSLRRRAAQLLRPHADAVPGAVGRRAAPHPRVRRREQRLSHRHRSPPRGLEGRARGGVGSRRAGGGVGVGVGVNVGVGWACAWSRGRCGGGRQSGRLSRLRAGRPPSASRSNGRRRWERWRRRARRDLEVQVPSGFTGAPCQRISKCRCSPVEHPVLPEMPSTLVPTVTSAPTFRRIR
jgi:hypothetical protein